MFQLIRSFRNTILRLDSNQLSMIGIDAFANLSDLQDLVLSFNLLTRISPRSFNSLRQLRHLYLDGNQIFSINKNVT